MDEKAATWLFRRSRTDIWIAVGSRMWWWTVGFIVLAALSGPGCGSKLSSTSVDSGCAPAAVAGNSPFLTAAGVDTGFDSCADGTLRRRAATQCPLPPTSPVPVCTDSQCTSDADCPQGQSAFFPKGYCTDAYQLKGYCGCYAGCREDADCAPGSICECGVVVGQCVPATCTTNADCGAGFDCVATAQGVADGTCNWTSNPPSPPLTEFVCQRIGDGCRNQADCADASTAGVSDAAAIVNAACLYDGTRRACGMF